MASLKSTVVSGSLRATDTIYTTTLQASIFKAPDSSNSATYGVGTDGQVLKSNGTSTYWGTIETSDVNVIQAAAITTAGAYPIILANSTATTAVTGTVNKTSTLTYNPNTKAFVTGGTVDGYTLAAACAKGVTDNSSNADVASDDTNLITGRTLYYQLANKNYLTSLPSHTHTLSLTNTSGTAVTNLSSSTSYTLTAGGESITFKTPTDNTGSSVSITLNGTATTSPSFYAPTTVGTNGYFLKSNGSGAPSWSNLDNTYLKLSGGGEISTSENDGSNLLKIQSQNLFPYGSGSIMNLGIAFFGNHSSSGYMANRLAILRYTINSARTAATLSLGVAPVNNTPGDSTYPTCSGLVINATNDTSKNYNATFSVKTGNLTVQTLTQNAGNDVAECRPTLYNTASGQCVADNDNGTLYISNSRLIPGAQIISDTYSTLIGKKSTAQTPVAIAGRVLAYPYQPRENYHAGMAVCSAPNGTVDIMTREEIRDYPDCIIGIVSEIPDYEYWGDREVWVDGRIWIKIK